MRFFEPVDPRIYAWLRISLGLASLIYFALLWPDRQVWLSDDGLVPSHFISVFREGNFWLLSPLQRMGRPGTVDFVMVLSLMSAFAMTIGFFSRTACALTAILMLSVQTRNPFVLHGGDQLLRILNLYLVFAPTGAFYSIDRKLARTHPPRWAPGWPLALIQYNLALMYLCAVIYKLQSPTWVNGTAAGFSLWLEEQRRFPMPSFFYGRWGNAISTHFTTGVEALMCLQAFWPRIRPWVLPLGVLLHLGIEYAFNIPIFSFTVLAGYVAFLDPDWMEKNWLHWKSIFGRGAGAGRWRDVSL